MWCARRGRLKELPPHKYHDPIVRNNDGWTVAMIAAYRGDITTLSSQWGHDPTLKNKIG